MFSMVRGVSYTKYVSRGWMDGVEIDKDELWNCYNINSFIQYLLRSSLLVAEASVLKEMDIPCHHGASW